MPNAFTITLAGQDITRYVQWLDDPSDNTVSWPNAQQVKIDSVLGQGAGNGGAASGRAATATFLTKLGPIGTAVGAGTIVNALPTTNLLSAQQSDAETGTDYSGFSLGLGASGHFAQDFTQAWHGSASFKVTTDGTGTFQSACANVPVASYTPGGTYTFSAYVLAATGQTPSLRFYCQANDHLSGNMSIGQVTTITPVSSGWTRYSVTVTLPASFTGLSIIGLRLDTGGTAQATTFFIDGLQIEQNSSPSAWVLGGTTSTPQLVRQGEVVITDSSGTVIFGGFAGQLHDATSRTQYATQVDSYDYWQQLAHIQINEVFDGVTDLTAIRYLITTYAPWIDLTLLPAFSATTLLGQVWRNKTLQWGLQQIADRAGYQIYVDPYKRLLYNTPTAAFPAPFSLSDTPDNSTSFPYQFESIDVDDTAIINRVTFYGGKQPTPDFAQDVSTQANGNNKVFVLAYYPRKSSSGQVLVSVGGVDQVVGYSLGTGAQNTLKSAGGDCDVLLDPSARTMTFDVAPAAGTSVICTYRYQIPLIIQLTEENSHAFYGRYYDGSISDETVVDSATAIQRCRVLLLEQAYGLTTIKLWCWKGGLQAGQQLQLTNTVRGINNTYIIQEVTAQPVSPTTVQYEVTLGAWNWNLVDVLQNLARATAGNDMTEVETITPTKVDIRPATSAVLSITTNTLTRSMGQYNPGAGLGMYPGLSSI